jgi:tRNA(Met) C34 N-acetyltransferase TmcA
MLRGISAPGTDLAATARQACRADLPWALGAGLRDLDIETAAVLLRGRDCADLALGTRDRQALRAIADGMRQPATAAALMWKVAVHVAADVVAAPEQLAPLLAWQLQHRPVGELSGSGGQRRFHEHVRGLLHEYLSTLSEQG